MRNLITTLSLLLSNFLFAATVDDLSFRLINSGTEYSVTDCSTSASGALSIPDTYDGIPVTTISEDAFLNCNNLTSINIPNSITTLGWYCFEGCTGLTSITIPGSINTIPYRAFLDCVNLTNVVLEYGVETIEFGAFAYCFRITNLEIPDSVVDIENGAFYDFTGREPGVSHFYDYQEANETGIFNFIISNSGLRAHLIEIEEVRDRDLIIPSTLENGALVVGVSGLTAGDHTIDYYKENLRSIEFPSTLVNFNFDSNDHGSTLGSLIPHLNTLKLKGNTLVANETSVVENNNFAVSSDEEWPYVITLTTVADGSSSQATQTLIINVTDENNYYRVVKTVANGNWYNAPSQALSIGENIITIPAVTFDRTVKIQLSSGDVKFDSLSVNGKNLFPISSEIQNYLTAPNFPDTWPDETGGLGPPLLWNLDSPATYLSVENQYLESYGGAGANWNGYIVISSDDELSELQNVIAERDNAIAAQTTAEAERDARPTQTAYDTVVAERDAALEAQTTVEAERDAALAAQATAEAERDAKLTLDEVKDLRAGSTMIEIENGIATLSMEVEESDDLNLEIWTTGGTASVQMDAEAGKKFYRFKMAE